MSFKHQKAETVSISKQAGEICLWIWNNLFRGTKQVSTPSPSPHSRINQARVLSHGVSFLFQIRKTVPIVGPEPTHLPFRG